MNSAILQSSLVWIVVLLALLGLWLVGVYNSLVRKKIEVDEAFSDVLTLLKQRYDMIPNLVNIVKGYAKHEKEIFEKVAKLRSIIANAKSVEDVERAEGELAKTLKTLFAVAENYPDLKANQNFLNLQDALYHLEEEIQKSRRYYNAVVREYNKALSVFPNVFIAPLFGFKPAEFFKATKEEQENVKIEF